jgi:methionyl-tRNA formyltransferase
MEIAAQMTGGQLHDALAAIGARMLCKHLPAIVAGSLNAVPQADEGVSYAHKLLREHGLLNWQLSAVQLANQVRGYDPTPGCAFEHLGHSYKVWAAHALAGTIQHPAGSIVSVTEHGVDIACGTGVLRITDIQKPGGKRLPVKVCWQHLGLN